MNGENALRQFFAEALHDSLRTRLGLCHEDVEEYLTELLVEFLHKDEIFSIRDESGRRLHSVLDMLSEGDVLLNAASFEREREVHKHVGDFLLFWSGVFPEFLESLRSRGSKDALLDPIKQGSLSYYVASTFDYGDFAREAPILRKLSVEFEAYIYGLSLMRAEYLIVDDPWRTGFEA